ncbi:MAG TPA: holo-ACP synthase [Thermoleophilia bacterium]|nr:holo-ACP synthase [Thermoleophilia bacterium]
MRLERQPGVTGVGIDAVEVDRVRRLLERLPRAYGRLFSGQERAYADGFADPFPRYAARFAAKEAVGKALGIGIIGFVWREIEVLSGGKPRVALHGHVAEIARRLGVARVELSLSHTAGMAYAVAVAVTEVSGSGAGPGRETHGSPAGAGHEAGEGG